jgi:hypothetical protein
VVTFDSGKLATINAQIPERNTVVSVKATSVPLGARIYLDNQLLGETPLDRLRLKSGEHTIRASRTGYQSLSEKVIFEKNQSYHLHFQLPSAIGVN